MNQNELLISMRSPRIIRRLLILGLVYLWPYIDYIRVPNLDKDSI